MNGCLKRPARAGALVVLACLLLLAGCGRTVFVSGGGYPSSQPGHAVSGQPLSEQADAAWRAGNYAEAERLYNVVARDAALPTEQRALAWERVARAALSSGNMQGAQNDIRMTAIAAWFPSPFSRWAATSAARLAHCWRR